jgi:RNA polymerase sigma-70 factor (ECF subfamily)
MIDHRSVLNERSKESIDSLTDLEIVEAVKRGEKKWFTILVRRHQKALLRLCFRFLREQSLAEDVVQESFIKAYEKLDSFEARASFKSWLFQIGVNTAKNKLRSNHDDHADISIMPLAIAPVAETSLVYGSVAKLLQQHIDELPFKQKTALVLRIYEDLSFKEIAEIMECPYDTAKANYRHAILRLKEELEHDKELGGWSLAEDGLFTELSAAVDNPMAEAE